MHVVLGCGYVGRKVAKTFTAREIPVTVTTTTAARVPELKSDFPNVVLARGHDEQAIACLVKEAHALLISVSTLRIYNVNAYEEAYLKTATTLCKALRESPPSNLKCILYTSSCSVFGERQGGLVDEESIIDPSKIHPPSRVLLETESLLLGIPKLHPELANVRVCILRLGGIYGPERPLKSVFSKLLGRPEIPFDSVFGSWVHVDDVVGCIDFALTNGWHGIYTLADDTPWTRERVDELCKSLNRPLANWNESLRSENNPHNHIVSNMKVKRAGYRFIHPRSTKALLKEE
mmetsp:Transcript_54864/g.91181  ORF Transcript_54864/g.91181 Transcript_54864/m.91181 type:complete len:291 (-) Transcript_54864:1025-1897(-)